MNRQSMETYLNDITVLDGNIDILTNIRPEDNEKLYLCDNYANVNADILTAFYSPVDTVIEIIMTQNVIELQPTNEYCRFTQTIQANARTVPLCGPIILCANAYTMLYIKNKNDDLKKLRCYGLSLKNDHERRILKRHTIMAKTSVPNVILEYKNGFVVAQRGEDPPERTGSFFIAPDPYYD